jgi:virginiamycin B lyase
MRMWNVTDGCIVIAVTLSVLAGPAAAQTGTNVIRPGREGKYAVTASKAIKTPTRAIGSLAGYDIVEIDSPSQVSGMGKMMALDSRGYIWYLESREDREVRIDPRTLEVTYYQLPAGSAPYSIAIDKNDTHWLTAHGIEMLLESHPEEGYCIARQPPSRGFLIHINVHNPTGSVWFSQPGNNQVVRFKAGEGFKEYPLPNPQAGPGRLDFDQDGNLWVPELYLSRLARLDTTTGKWREWDLPSKDAMPAFVRVDDEGTVWVSEPQVDKIARFKNGSFKEFTVPTVGSVVSSNITDREGRLWFTQGGWRGSAGGNKVAVLEPETGRIVEFELPTKQAQPNGLLIDREGVIWFMQTTGGRVTRAARQPMGSR